MNTEQLQLILNTFQSLGVEGKEAFLWWLAFDKLPAFFGWLAFLAVILHVFRRIMRSLHHTKTLEELRDLLGIGSPGFIDDHEIRQLVRRVRELKEKEGR